MMTPCCTVKIDLGRKMKGIEQAYRQHVLICQTAVKSYEMKDESVWMSITVTSSLDAVCLDLI